jgi:hypothetical protein
MADTKSEQEISEKINMFNKLPTKCLACNSSFDRKNKKMVREWHVVVKRDPAVVKLYCPKCWNTLTNKKERENE